MDEEDGRIKGRKRETEERGDPGDKNDCRIPIDGGKDTQGTPENNPMTIPRNREIDSIGKDVHDFFMTGAPLTVKLLNYPGGPL